jgi:hypothetical protein
MKKSFLILIALVSITIAKAQSADDIIAKHIDAVGGKDKVSQITSVYIESNTNVMNMDAPTKTYIVPGKGYRTESDFNGQKLVQTITDKGGWSINPFMGGTDATAMPDDEYQLRYDELFAVDPLVNYAADGAKVELQGQEKVGDVNAYKIKYTNKFGKDVTFYIDPTTYYITETSAHATVQGQDVTVTTNFSNYQKTDYGITMANSINADMGQFQLAVTVQKVVINQPVDATLFDMPK